MVPERTARVLIADPDPDLRRQLFKRLLDRDVFSDAVPDGKTALAKMNEQAYAVVLLDPELPAAGAAQEILAKISATPVRQRPVVLVLASSRVAKSFDVDVVQVVLRKPCNIAQLAEIVRSCARVASEHRETPAGQTKRLTTEESSSA